MTDNPPVTEMTQPVLTSQELVALINSAAEHLGHTHQHDKKIIKATLVRLLAMVEHSIAAEAQPERSMRDAVRKIEGASFGQPTTKP
jgi:hypothetical protein